MFYIYYTIDVKQGTRRGGVWPGTNCLPL